MKRTTLSCYTDKVSCPTPFVITNKPLELEHVIDTVTSTECNTETKTTSIGAITSFLGVVRGNHAGKRVLHLEYEAYVPLALETFKRIGMEIDEKWPAVHLAIHHRTGRLEIGETSIVIVTTSEHRGNSFTACRYAIERVKQITPIWKCEFFEDGNTWIEGATADPEDVEAKVTAYQRACE